MFPHLDRNANISSSVKIAQLLSGDTTFWFGVLSRMLVTINLTSKALFTLLLLLLERAKLRVQLGIRVFRNSLKENLS